MQTVRKIFVVAAAVAGIMAAPAGIGAAGAATGDRDAGPGGWPGSGIRCHFCSHGWRHD